MEDDLKLNHKTPLRIAKCHNTYNELKKTPHFQAGKVVPRGETHHLKREIFLNVS